MGKLKLKQSIKEGLTAFAFFMYMFCIFWRTVLYGYPSDLEGLVWASIPMIVIYRLLKNEKERNKKQCQKKSHQISTWK